MFAKQFVNSWFVSVSWKQ